MIRWLFLCWVLVQDSSTPAENLHNEGMRLFEQSKYDEAIPAVLESLRMHEAAGLKMEQAINLRLLAVIHDATGERQKSLGFYNRALKLARDIPNRGLESRTLRDMGVLFYNLDDNTRAFQHFEQALALQRKDGKPGPLASTLFAMGELRRYRGNLKEARTALETALPLAREAADRSAEADILSSLAMVDLKQDLLDSSRERCQQALSLRQELKDIRGEASTRLKIGMLLDRQHQTSASINELRQAITLFETNKYKGGEAFARQTLAMLLRKSGNLPDAAAEMLRAIELAETLRQRLADRDLRATYIGYVQNRYEFLMDTLLELDAGNPRRAFEISERARARALVEELRDAGVGDAADAQPTLSLPDIQQQVLDPATTLIEYSLGEPHSHAFIVTHRSITHRQLPGRTRLEALARQAYEAYRQPGSTPPAATLRKLLLGNNTTGRLVIVADGALQYLPFAHLAPDATVTIAPSASAIAVRRALPRRSTPAQRLAVFADPDAPQLTRLPFARQEGQSITALLPTHRAHLSLGPAATPAAVLQSRAEILHLAAHSNLDTERPERTEIVLTGGSLRLRDIYRMKLDSRLVVLSACQTALGKSMKREGLIGLTRAFEQAGAERVLASLWKVEDRATSELMLHFYQALLVDQLPASQALKHAQTRLQSTRRWNHPFYWAGFVLEGEWR